MPTPCFMTIEGKNQKLITKEAYTAESVGNWQEGHEDEFLVQAFDHTVTVPTDPQSGQVSGQRVHKPLTITKVFDRSSPLLYNAVASGEKLKCQIKWYRTSPMGVQEHYFTIELEDAVITNIRAHMPNCQDPAMASFTHLEDVSFAYGRITWTHEVCGVSGADDWKKPKY